MEAPMGPFRTCTQIITKRKRLMEAPMRPFRTYINVITSIYAGIMEAKIQQPKHLFYYIYIRSYTGQRKARWEYTSLKQKKTLISKEIVAWL